MAPSRTPSGFNRPHVCESVLVGPGLAGDGACYIGLADLAGAREVVRHASTILRQRPNLGVLGKQAGELRSNLDSMRTGQVGASSLTTAELRLVPYLSTHLTFPADRRAALRLAEHDQVPGDLDISEARCFVPGRGSRAPRGDRLIGRLRSALTRVVRSCHLDDAGRRFGV